MTRRIFLPARRDGTLLIFEHRERPRQRRWEFTAVAAQEPDSELARTGNGGLNADEFAYCQKLALLLPQLEAHMSNFGFCDVSPDNMGLDMPNDLAFVEGSPVLTLALMLHLKRDLLVAETSLKRYLSQPAKDRFELGLSASIYVSMIRTYRLNGANEIVDEDLAATKKMSKANREWGYYYAQAGYLKHLSGDFEGTIAINQKALELGPSADAWRRIANAQVELGQTEAAIASFVKCDELSPLKGPAALRLARLAFGDGQTDVARKYAEVASHADLSEADKLLRQISGGSPA